MTRISERFILHGNNRETLFAVKIGSFVFCAGVKKIFPAKDTRHKNAQEISPLEPAITNRILGI